MGCKGFAERKSSVGRVRGGALAVLAVSAFSGCALTPVPVRILSVGPKEPLPARGLKVALVVTDSRVAACRNTNIFGTKRNGLQIPLAPVFLAHTDGFDKIVARSAKGLLEGAGYKVGKTVPDLSDADSKRDAPEEDKTQRRAKMGAVRGEYSRHKAEVREAKSNKGEAVDAEADNRTVDGAALPEDSLAEAVVEVRIRSFFTDMNPAISWLWPVMHSWLLADVYVYPAGSGPRTVTFGKKVKTYTACTWFAFDNGESAYNLTVNHSFRNVMRRMEKHFRSEPFAAAVNTCQPRGPEEGTP